MASDGVARKKGKKNRKVGRNIKWCSGYSARGQREINKAKKIQKHLKKHPDDAGALLALKNLKGG